MATEQDIRQGIIDSGRRVLEHLYGFMAPGTPVEYKATDLAATLDLPMSLADDRCVELTALGILSRTINYGRHNPDGTYKIGRFAMWELHKPKEQAVADFEAWAVKLLAGETTALETHQQGGRNVKPGKSKPKAKKNGIAAQPVIYTESSVDTVTLASTSTEETRAIAGPDAASPMATLAPLRKADDATALIEAARQYAKRGDKVQDHIKALQATAKDLGIDIDEKVLMAGIKLERDERLETISLVLPVIDRLERTVERLSSGNTELRDRAQKVETLENENRRLRSRVEALVSERVVSQQRAQAN